MEQNELAFQELKKIITTRIRGIYQPSWAIAFSGGGMRAAAHIGVIAAFEENDIFPDMIAGSSTGSVIAAAYALGIKTEEILKFFIEESGKFLDFDITKEAPQWFCTKTAEAGFLLDGQILENIFAKLFGDADFSQMKAPCFIVATDLAGMQEVIFSTDRVATACRASVSAPGVFTPYEQEEKIIVDGFVLNNLPSNVLREKGAQIVIGINAQAGKNARAKSARFLDVFNTSIELLSAASMQKGLVESDLIIEPKMDEFTLFSTEESNIKKMYELGYEAAMSRMDDIAALFVRNNS